jgi:hypothetical protein
MNVIFTVCGSKGFYTEQSDRQLQLLPISGQESLRKERIEHLWPDL